MQPSGLLLPFIPVILAQSVHVVKVGDGGLKFNPARTKAAVGDVVEFHFVSAVHSVAKGIFADPCQPSNSTGFFSGDVDSSSKKGQVFTIKVEDDEPIWYYCATGPHCQLGMVGVINGPSVLALLCLGTRADKILRSSGGQTLDAYTAAAADAKAVGVPSNTGGGSFDQASTTPSGTAPASTASESNKPSAGVEARGDIRWGLMTAGIAMFGFVSVLIL